MAANEQPEPASIRRRRRSMLGKRERRAVLVFLAASFAAAALIVLAAVVNREPPPIMPPESPEELALRASPDNAYLTLANAIKLLPPPPGPLFAQKKDNAGFVGLYTPQPDSLGLMLNVRRPDEDPEFLAYLAATAPALEELRAALDHEYFRFPSVDSPAHVAELGKLDSLTKLAAATAIYRVRAGLSSEERDSIVDLMRVGALLDQDGGLNAHAYAVQSQTNALRAAWDAGLGVMEDSQRDAVLAELSELSLADAPMGQHLDFEWRVLDLPNAYWLLIQSPEGARRPVQDPDDFFERLMIGRMMKKLRRHVRENKEAYLEAAQTPLVSFEDWQARHPEFLRSKPFFDPIYGIANAVLTRASLDAWVRGWHARAKIEDHLKEHGHPPTTLEEAGVTVVDPFSGGPFHYRVVGNDYTLYSDGIGRSDDGGNPVNDRDIVLHRAAAEPPVYAPPPADIGQLLRRERRR